MVLSPTLEIQGRLLNAVAQGRRPVPEAKHVLADFNALEGPHRRVVDRYVAVLKPALESLVRDVHIHRNPALTASFILGMLTIHNTLTDMEGLPPCHFLDEQAIRTYLEPFGILRQSGETHPSPIFHWRMSDDVRRVVTGERLSSDYLRRKIERSLFMDRGLTPDMAELLRTYVYFLCPSSNPPYDCLEEYQSFENVLKNSHPMKYDDDQVTHHLLPPEAKTFLLSAAFLERALDFQELCDQTLHFKHHDLIVFMGVLELSEEDYLSNRFRCPNLETFRGSDYDRCQQFGAGRGYNNFSAKFERIPESLKDPTNHRARMLRRFSQEFDFLYRSLCAHSTHGLKWHFFVEGEENRSKFNVMRRNYPKKYEALVVVKPRLTLGSIEFLMFEAFKIMARFEESTYLNLRQS